MSTSEATAGAAGGYNTADAHRLDITHIIYTSICDSSTKLGCRKPPLYSSSRDLLANYIATIELIVITTSPNSRKWHVRRVQHPNLLAQLPKTLNPPQPDL